MTRYIAPAVLISLGIILLLLARSREDRALQEVVRLALSHEKRLRELERSPSRWPWQKKPCGCSGT